MHSSHSIFQRMRHMYSSFLWIIVLFFCAKEVRSQEKLPAVQNIFSTIRSDPSGSLWTFKKTEILRINVVKMEGESKLHKHPDADHTVLVIKGRIQAEVDGKNIKLKKGDMISIPAGMPHKYSIKGKKAIIVSMDAPYYDPGKTIILE